MVVSYSTLKQRTSTSITIWGATRHDESKNNAIIGGACIVNVRAVHGHGALSTQFQGCEIMLDLTDALAQHGNQADLLLAG